MWEGRGDRLFRSILGGGAVSLSVRLTGLVLGFLSHILLSRSLGASSYGLYVVAVGWVMIIVVPVKFGLDHSVLRFASRYVDQGQRDKLGHLVRFAFVFVAAMAAVAGGLIIAVQWIWPDVFAATTPGALAAMIALVAALAYLGVYGAFFRAAQKIFYSQFFEQVLRSAALIAGLVLLAWTGGSITFETALAVTALAAWLAVLAMVVPLRRALRLARAGDTSPVHSTGAPQDADGPRAWLSVSWPIFVATLAQQAQTQTSIIALGLLASEADAGRYAAAARLATLVAFALVALNSVSAPMISAAYGRGDREELRRIAMINARLATIGGLAISLVLLALGPYALAAFGPEFVSAYPALAILLAAGVVNAALGPAGNYLTMTRLQMASMALTVATLLVTLLAAAILIPLWGMVGGAIAAAIGIVTQKLLAYVVVWRVLRIDTSCLGLRLKQAEA